MKGTRYREERMIWICYYCEAQILCLVPIIRASDLHNQQEEGRQPMQGFSTNHGTIPMQFSEHHQACQVWSSVQIFCHDPISVMLFNICCISSNRATPNGNSGNSGNNGNSKSLCNTHTGYRILWLSPNDTFVCIFHQFPTWKESFRLWKVFCVWKCQIPLCRVASFPSVALPVYPKIALLPNDYYDLVTCPEVVTISDNQCIKPIAVFSSY